MNQVILGLVILIYFFTLVIDLNVRSIKDDLKQIKQELIITKEIKRKD